MKKKPNSLDVPDDYWENEPLPPGTAKGEWSEKAKTEHEKFVQGLEDFARELDREEREKSRR